MWLLWGLSTMNQPPSARWPSHPAATQQVHVDVKDCLPRISIRIHHRSVARIRNTFSLGDLRGEERQATDQLGVAHLVERFNVLARNDDDVGRRLWIDVVEGHAMIGLGDQFRGDFLPNDSAEKTFIGHASPRSLQIHRADYCDSSNSSRLESKC